MRNDPWYELGEGYPGKDKEARIVFDILAPTDLYPGDVKPWRTPLFEWGKEETPTPTEVWDICIDIVVALEEHMWNGIGR